MLRSLRERKVVVAHDKLDRIATLATAEAVKGLALRVHIEARRLFIVKRTQREVIHPSALQREIPLDQLDDIRLVEDLLDRFLGNNGHSRRGTQRDLFIKPTLLIPISNPVEWWRQTGPMLKGIFFGKF